MTYDFRLIQIVSAAHVDAARVLAQAIDPDPNSTGGFSVPLSGDGGTTITHYAQSTVCTQVQLHAMAVQRLNNTDAQQIDFWRLHAVSQHPAQFPPAVAFPDWSSVPVSMGRDLNTPVTFQDALNDLGLVRYVQVD